MGGSFPKDPKDSFPKDHSIYTGSARQTSPFSTNGHGFHVPRRTMRSRPPHLRETHPSWPPESAERRISSPHSFYTMFVVFGVVPHIVVGKHTFAVGAMCENQNGEMKYCTYAREYAPPASNPINTRANAPSFESSGSPPSARPFLNLVLAASSSSCRTLMITSSSELCSTDRITLAALLIFNLN